jgi:hypothetical protein
LTFLVVVESGLSTEGIVVELNEFFQRELAEEGYSGVEVRVTPTVTDISTSNPLALEELVQLGIEDTVGDELSALRNSSLNSGHFDAPTVTDISTSNPKNQSIV